MNSPSTIAKMYVDIGMKKAKLPYLKMLVLSIYAGMFIASGGVLATVCSYGMSGGYSRFYKGIAFPLGLMLVCCAGAELFTGNCLCRKFYWRNFYGCFSSLFSCSRFI